MASTATTTLTFKRSVILKKLETRVSEMKKEIEAWEKENALLDSKQEAWDKRARAWLKKNAASLINDNTSVHNNHHYSNKAIRFTLEASPDKVIAVIGEYPQQDCRPAWDRAEYRGVSPIEELEANIAAFKAAEEDEIKVSIKNNIFRYIK